MNAMSLHEICSAAQALAAVVPVCQTLPLPLGQLEVWHWQCLESLGVTLLCRLGCSAQALSFAHRQTNPVYQLPEALAGAKILLKLIESLSQDYTEIVT